MTPRTLRTAAFAGMCLLLAGLPAYSAEETTLPQLSNGGAGDLLVAPTRVMLEGRARAAEIVLSNKGMKEATYRVSFTYLQMREDGSYAEITQEQAKAGVGPADTLLRYSPHQVTLKPGESQIVKVMARKPEGLADGEYISHLLFRAVPDMATGEDVEAAKTGDGKISIRLIPIYGVSIPIIVRQGALAAQASLQEVKRMADGLSLAIVRNGNQSLFGDLIVTQGSAKNVVGQLRGIAVLAYSGKRVVSVPLGNAAPGPLTVEYRAREDEGGKTLAKAEIN